MKAYLGTLHVTRAADNAAVTVRLASPETAEAFREAAREEGYLVVRDLAARTSQYSPSIIAALVLGCVFALIGLQGLNVLLGLPRVDNLFWMPSGIAGVLFTAAGIGLGTLMGSVISSPGGDTQDCSVRLRGSPNGITRLAREFGGLTE